MKDPNDKTIEFTIEPSSEEYDPSDERWLDQVNALTQDLQRNVGKVRAENTPVEGTKGGAEAIILALGSAGVITAAVDVFRAWLGQGRKRSVKVSIDRDGKKQTVVVSGMGMDKDDIRTFMTRAFEKASP